MQPRRGAMMILEARFHPGRRGGGPGLLVGRVRCGNGVVVVEPAFDAPDGGASALMAKLNFIVGSCGPDRVEGLLDLRSEYWSFIDVTPAG